jgi:Mrp family chromosome partitioning ATPase
MSQAEIVKSPIISVVRRSVDGAARSNGHANGGTRPTEAVTTTFAWEPPPISIVEEVDLPARPDPRLVVLNDPDSACAQSFRLLEHRLVAKGRPRVVAVTSAEPSAGKTTCAANLALVLSRAALSRVLLVDANLQRPGIADLFGFHPADSLMVKLLRSEDATPPYPVATVSGVSLQIAALPADMARGKQVDRALFADALRSLRGAYDWIVVDTSSVLENADVHCVTQSADGVIVVARAGKSRSRALRRAVEQLEPAKVLGTVLIDH